MRSALKKSYSSFDICVTVIFLLCPILRIYGFGKVDFSMIATGILIIINVFHTRRWSLLPKYLIVYLAYWAMIKVFTASSVYSAIPLMILYNFLYCILFFENIKLDLLIKYYEIIGIICIVFFWFQQIGYWTTGTRILGIAKFLPISFLDEENFSHYINILASGIRSASFFSEPSHFAQFLLPLLTIELFKFDKRSDIFSVIIIATLVFLQSGNGFLGLIIILIGYFIYVLRHINKSPLRTYSLILLIIVLGFWMALIMPDSELGNSLIARRNVETSGKVANTSGFMRIFRGYYVYDDLSISEKIFGQSDNAKLDQHIKKCKVSNTFGVNDRYFNTFQNIIIRTGIIGLLLFILLFLSLWRDTSYVGKIVLLCFFALSFISSLFFSQVLVLYLIIPAKMKIKEISII